MMKRIAVLFLFCVFTISISAAPVPIDAYTAERFDNDKIEFNNIAKKFEFVYFIASNTIPEDLIKKNMSININGEKVSCVIWTDEEITNKSRFFEYYNFYTPVDDKGKRIKLKNKSNNILFTYSDNMRFKDVYYGISGYTDSYYEGFDLIRTNGFLIFPSELEVLSEEQKAKEANKKAENELQQLIK
ncbi:MAG: hypothetical protein II890_04825 [Spirochaetia bacterium]|nr:hypothetical protein [Spirochaetia bacterium]